MSEIKMKNATDFQLKADFFPMTVLQLSQFEASSLQAELKTIIAKAPNYFKDAPVVIDVEHWNTDYSTLDLATLCSVLKSQAIIPAGIRGLPQHYKAKARKQNLAIISTSKKTKPKPDKTIETPPETKHATPNTSAKIIHKPIRSGTKVYAKNADLIILSSVNSGGECIADGNIHIYGPLRGRALAGASGNTEARIFCTQLEAELISISGHYLTQENLIPSSGKSMTQVYLENNKLVIGNV